MGKYHDIAEKFDKMAQQAFREYAAAEKSYREAREAKLKTPLRSGWGVSPEYMIKAQEADLCYRKADAAFREAKSAYRAKLAEVRELRSELESQLKESLMADPKEFDVDTVNLLKSGMCNAADVESLYHKAKDSGNVTMQRYISSHAAEMAKKATDDDSRRRMNYIASETKNRGELQRSPLDAFDVMQNVFTRCINNPRMIEHWSELTGEAQETM